MTWFPFRAQAALDRTGTPRESGVGNVYAIDDVTFSTPLTVREIGGGAVMPNISVENFLTQEFEVEDHEEVYWRSGTAPAVHLISAKGMADAARAAQAAAESARDTVVAAGEVTDEGIATHISNPSSATRQAVLDVIPASTVVSSWLPRMASYTTIEDKLADWRTALGGSGLAQAVVIGDSISEGTGASTALNRWVSRLQALLRYRSGRTIGADWPFIPAYPITGTGGFPVSRSGTVTHDNARGLGWRSVIIGADGTLHFTFTGTSFKIPHLKASGTGVMRVVIDADPAVLVDTNAVSNPPGANAAVWESPTLTRGVHTVKITRDPTSGSGQNPYVHGLITYDRDEASGVRILDGSYHGIATSFFTSGRNTQMAAAITAAGPVQLVVIAVGTNDYGASTDPATYKQSILDLIAAIRAGGFTGSFVLVNMYSNVTRSGYEIYGVKMREIAAADAKVAYFDLRVRMPDVPNPVTAPEGFGLYADGLHPNDQGHEWMAYVFSDYLSLRS